MKINRATQPPVIIPQSVPVLFPATLVADNGVKIYSIEAEGQEVLRMSLVFRAGTRFQRHPFQASATLNMLNEGSERYSAQEISEKIDFYGAYFDVNIDRDYSVISMCCLVKFLPQMLDVLEQIVMHPIFSAPELDIYRNKRKHSLVIEREKVGFRTRELFGEALFGEGHPYGTFYSHTEYDTLTTDHLKSFYHDHYHAGNCFAVTSGKASAEDLALIRAWVNRIPAGEAVGFAPLPKPESILELTEEVPQAVQSAIRVGKLLFPRNHPDFIGMQVLLMVLGGYFGSRLMSNLREEHGYTYGVFATMVNLEASGYLAVATEVGAEFTRDAVQAIYHEIGRLREELIPEQELDMVKNMITGEFMRILDGPFGIADVTIENIQNGNDNAYINNYLHEVKAITPERLNELAVKYLDSEGFVTVIVGKP